MKKLKYLLFIALTSILFLNPVNAQITRAIPISNNNYSLILADNTDFDTTNFCSRSGVSNVFRTLGWILWIVKIIVPLVIIIFGCIDFAKAMVASKDDEIKKTARILVFRSIAGIIIFFIPTIISFVVELIGGKDVYTGSNFGVCTNCILHPDECVVKDLEKKETTPTAKPQPNISNNKKPSSSGSGSGSSSSSSQQLSTTAGTTTKSLGGVTYLETVPENATTNLPLIIFFHGTSERNNLAGLKNLKPVTFVTSNEAFKNGKFIFIAPVLTSTYWSDIQSSMMNIINTTVENYKINKQKIILMGFSLGGVGVWSYINAYPNFFSAAVPVSGCSFTSGVSNYTNTPIWAISGSQENTYKTCMGNLVNSINSNGGNAKYSTAGTNHAGAQSSFPNNEVFSWALSQTRK